MTETMYCKECGKQLEADVKFCQSCGTKVNEQVGLNGEQSTFNKDSLPFKDNESFTFIYNRGTGISKKVTTSEVEVSGQSMKLKQTLARPFRKAKTTDKEIKLQDINNVTVKRKMNFVYGIWTVIALFCALFYNPLFAIAVGAFIWLGLYKVHVINTSSDRLTIPFQGNKEEFDQLKKLIEG